MVINRVLQNYFQSNITASKRVKKNSRAELETEKKVKQKDPLDEYLEKWAREKEIQQKVLDEKLQNGHRT